MNDDLSLWPTALSRFLGALGTVLFAVEFVWDVPAFWKPYPLPCAAFLVGHFIGGLCERCVLRRDFRAKTNLIRALSGDTILGWRSAGRPRTPGFHEVPGLGPVWFDEEDIQAARARKGRIAFRLLGSRAMGDATTEYTVIEHIPM